ncbi:MAG: ferrochelatase [Acidobacteria bacterium]|nr:ferrochelatase [Acidobacteriota bacterium]
MPQTSIATETAVLLLNMGGPRRPGEIEAYLRRIFSDRDMIAMPGGHFYQDRLAKIIAARRAPRVAERYGLIGGASPLDTETRKQATGLARLLDCPVTYAMRYIEPFIPQALADLNGERPRKVVVIPLYPQYSRATTLSAIREFRRHAGNRPHVFVEDHHDHPGYIAALAELAAQSLARLENGGKRHTLFVAHSIPRKAVVAGDPYVAQTEATVRAVTERLSLDGAWSLAYSSRVGPVRWQGPSLEEELARLAGENVRQLVVVPVSFVAENLETLYDLDHVFRQQCAAAGISRLERVPALGDSPRYLAALADLAATAARKLEAEHA